MPPVIATSDAKAHLRVFHALDDEYIASLVSVVVAEWQTVTGMCLESTTQAKTTRFETAPVGGIFRFPNYPIDKTTGFFTLDTTPLVTTELDITLYRSIHNLVVYDGSTLIDSGAFTFPMSITTQAIPQTDAPQIIQALLLRLGYYYSFRGDDPQPPNSDGWLMLAARHRIGSIL